MQNLKFVLNRISRAEASRMLGICQSNINYWIKVGYISNKMALKIKELKLEVTDVQKRNKK
jgi:hypothetical protein